MESLRVTGGRAEDRPAVTRADIDRHPLVAGDDPGELTDVHLDEAASDDRRDHGGRIAAAARIVDAFNALPRRPPTAGGRPYTSTP